MCAAAAALGVRFHGDDGDDGGGGGGGQTAGGGGAGPLQYEQAVRDGGGGGEGSSGGGPALYEQTVRGSGGSGRELAILCQKVENLVVGAPCGGALQHGVRFSPHLEPCCPVKPMSVVPPNAQVELKRGRRVRPGRRMRRA